MAYNEKEVEILQVESMPEEYSDSSEVKLSEAELDKMGRQLVARLQELRSERVSSKWQKERERDFNAYHMLAVQKPLPYVGYPNLACPLPRIGIDTFHANVLYTFGGQTGKFTVLPDALSRSHIDVAERAAKYLTYVLNYEADMYTALDKADMDAETYGNGYMEPRYVKEHVYETRKVTREEVVPEINELTGEVSRKTITRKKKERVKVCTFDGTKIERITAESIIYSSFFETLKEAARKDYVFKTRAYTFRNLEEMAQSSDDDDAPYLNAKKVKKLKDFHTSQIVSDLERAKQTYDGFQVERKLEVLPIELAEAHFWQDVNDDGVSEKVTAIFETQTGEVLRVNYGACRIVELKPRPVDGRAQGESIRRATQSLLVEWEAIHNARVAKGQWANLPFFFYKSGGRFNPQTISLMPGKGYPVDDTSAINFPQLPPVDVSYFNEEKIILDYFERVLALGESLQGIAPSGNSTATETINAQQRAGVRLSTPINRIAMALNDLVGHIWDLNRQCAPELKEFQVAGTGNGVPVFDKMTSKDFSVMCNFKLSMATMYDTQMVRDTALLNYRTFITNPLVLNNPATFYEMTARTMKAVGLELTLPKPEQALVKSPFMEHDLIERGEELEPTLGEDTDEHLAAHMALMKSDEYKEWPEDAKQRLTTHVDKTYIQKEMLRMANLNKSGIFEGMGPSAGDAPSMTATRNPSQAMNNMRVGESGKSMNQNVKNGMGQ